MYEILQFEKFVCDRITELREKRGISEHRLSLELGKSGSYIRSITSGATMPSVKELFNIILYFEMSPADFFVGTEGKDTLRTIVTKQLHPEITNASRQGVVSGEILLAALLYLIKTDT